MIWIGGALADWFINRGYDPISVRKGFTILGFGFAATQTIGAYTNDTNLMLIFAVVSMWGLGFAHRQLLGPHADPDSRRQHRHGGGRPEHGSQSGRHRVANAHRLAHRSDR